MKIVDLIHRDMVVPELKATDKRGILEELAAHMAEHHPRIDGAALSKVLIESEQLESTALGEGVAIPHGKLGAVDQIVACLGRATKGVAFDAVDGPTCLFFVLVAPQSDATAHLKALAHVSRVFKDREFRRRLLSAPDAASMYQVVAEVDHVLPAPEPVAENKILAIADEAPRRGPLEVTNEGTETTLHFRGSLDINTVSELHDWIDEILAAKPTNVVCDLSGLDLIDASGVEVLVKVYKHVRSTGGAASMINAHDQPLAILKMLRMDKVFNL